MPPNIDVYVWVDTDDPARTIGRFIDRYVDVSDPGDTRLDAFVRRFVVHSPWPGDEAELAEMRRHDDARNALSLYVHSTYLDGAIITVTEEGGVVLGLTIDDAEEKPETTQLARDVMCTLMHEFHARGGIAGVEVVPPQSRAEWRDAPDLLLRVGKV